MSQKTAIQECFIYLDDSGVLHNNSKERFFIYAGYIFLSKIEKDAALANYRSAARQIQESLNMVNKEAKAYILTGVQKRFLNSRLARYESFSCVVDKAHVYDSILNNKKSIHRYKDYCLKRASKNKIRDLIDRNLLDPTLPTTLRFFIDNQPTSTDGIYNLRESIKEEFQNGIANFDYGVRHEALFSGHLEVFTNFCDSSKNYLIQASDILANSLYTKYNYGRKFKIPHTYFTETKLP